jgi:hypothetical protein
MINDDFTDDDEKLSEADRKIIADAKLQLAEMPSTEELQPKFDGIGIDATKAVDEDDLIRSLIISADFLGKISNSQYEDSFAAFRKNQPLLEETLQEQSKKTQEFAAQLLLFVSALQSRPSI